MSNITIVGSMTELERLTVSATAVTLIDFHATWCGPCKAIAPVFQRLANTYQGRIQFAKVDVDQARDVAATFSVTAMPTFVMLRGMQKLAEVKGADPTALENLCRQHALAAGTKGAGTSAATAEKGLEGTTSLNGSIDQSAVQCLNENASHTIRDLLKGGGDKWLESDADEQLLMHIPTQQSIKLRAIRFKTVESKLSQAPKTVRIFVNAGANPISFDDAESLEPAQEVVLTEEQAKGKEAVQLRFVRFQNVNTLSIFVADNQQEEDTTRIDSIDLIGLANQGTDMSALRKQEDDE
ncbi:hypothetical protein OIV83_001636 [Microbotryomycetes sp. JL201]|nr:hypothetical protein OIV83_001636 [Microbotryomycetes sp. JL201]